ncbi:MAG: hypothetical protein ACOZE5_06690 [Verrucomicrobiota bacterium]
MMPRSLKPAALVLLAALPALLPAQETSAREDERMNQLLRNDGPEWREPRTRVTVGLRFLRSGGTVRFGNLGERIPATIAPVSAGAADRTYDNGAVFADGLRNNEKDANGNQVPLADGRYTITNSDGKVVQDLLGYQAGRTRDWNAKYEAQKQPHAGYIGFDSYTAVSEGGGFSEEQGATGGLELQLTRDLGRVGRRMHWGLAAGITLNGINSKAAGTVTSTLRTRTDYYQVIGSVTPSLPYATPSFTFLFDGEGNVVNEAGYETTVPLNSTPDAALSTVTDLAGGAQVRGNWQVKGAYFMAKVGPALRWQITDRFGLNASAGFAGAYAGTRYTVFETFTIPSMSDLEITVDDPAGSTATEFLTGYYADLSLEWLANERTGLFGGVTAQQLDSYDQTLGGRTAKIDLGNTVGIRGGVSIRF